MLKIKNISAGYGKKQVLFDVSFNVGLGEIVLLIGGNGAGKSTVLKAIYGLLKPYNGSKVFFDGKDITGSHSSNLIQRGLVYIPQKDNCFEELTVQENLEVAGLTLKDKKVLSERIDYVYQVLSLLSEFRQSTPFKMSGGERQLLALGMALLHQPKLILFDEPTAGLSPKNTGKILEKISELNNSKISFVIVEHKVKETIKLADKIIGLKYGKIFKNIDCNNKVKNKNTDLEYIKLLDDVFV
ncbi:MAG: ATP-binding cassette domain-containing protein [bacterium]